MSITLLLSAILIGYSRDAGRQLVLINGQAKIINIISRAKSLSVTTFVDTNGLPADSNAPKICGYGVHVDRELGQIFIFRDLARDCSTSDNVFNDKGEVSDVPLTSNLDIFSLPDTTIQFSDVTLTDVLFIPPDPTIIINNGALQSAQVTLQSKDKVLSALVKIDNAGKISTK